MVTKVNKGMVVFRQQGSSAGMSETKETFETLDDLFRLFVEHKTIPLIDRIEIEGIKDDGKKHKLTLVFQSMTIE